MIKLESIYIEEIRGIRKLELDFRKETFAISGPNGSGKSGIIDAIEFGLTGQMGRLTGPGTKGLSVGLHGPHVDKVKFPDAAFVKLKIFLADLNKSLTITRFVSSPKKPKIEPDSPAIRAALEEIGDHPEITLSRREILRFILVEPTKRSEEIQTLLKLEEIGEARKTLNSVQNKLGAAKTDADVTEKSRSTTLQLHLQIPNLKTEALLEVVNKKRKILGLVDLESLTKDTALDEGMVKNKTANELNKESALRDAKALKDALAVSAELGKDEAEKIVADLVRLDGDATLLKALQQRDFVEKGLGLVDKAQCPLCDNPWPDIDHLKAHLQAKLDKSAEAKKLQDGLTRNADLIGTKLTTFVGLLPAVAKIAETLEEKEFAKTINSWKADLETFKSGFNNVDKIRKAKSRFERGWLEVPESFEKKLEVLTETIRAKPDQSATIDAQTFLTTAQSA